MPVPGPGGRRAAAGQAGWFFWPGVTARVRWGEKTLNPGPGLRQDRAQDLLHLVEVLLGAGQRGRELDDGVAAVVGPADEPGVEQRVRQEPAQQPLGLVVVERLACGLVLHQLAPVEVPDTADVAHDRQV